MRNMLNFGAIFPAFLFHFLPSFLIFLSPSSGGFRIVSDTRLDLDLLPFRSPRTPFAARRISLMSVFQSRQL